MAREAAAQVHETLGALKLLKADTSTTPVDVEAANTDNGVNGKAGELARVLQLRILALRRSHRAMAKAAELGRTAEAAARRTADAEFAHLETRRHESACFRAAASRCRIMETPHLSEVLPLCEGNLGDAADDDKEER